MISFVLERVRGIWVALLALVSVGYGWLIIVALPYWNAMVAAEGGGPELQERFLYGAAEAGRALAAIDANARPEALIFYALDVPNAALYGLGIAGMIAFGLRQLGWDKTIARGLVALPLIAGVADWFENACLTIALLTNPAEPGFWGEAAGALTSAKFVAGWPAQILGLALVGVGLCVWAWRKIRSSARPSPS